MIFGYARVSTENQKLNRQMDELREAGAEVIYSEKETGKKKDRPELNRLLQDLRKGDVVLVTEFSRLSRSTFDLLSIAEQINQKEADIKSLKEQWMDTRTPGGKFIFTIMSGLAEFEREQIVERTKSGLRAAKARGRVGGRKAASKEKVELALKMKADGYSYDDIRTATTLARSTVIKYDKLNKKECG